MASAAGWDRDRPRQGSILETDKKLAGLDSNQKDIKKNVDGSVTVWFGPETPAGQESNWV